MYKLLLLAIFASAVFAACPPSSVRITEFSTTAFTEGGAVSASVGSGYKLIGGGFQGQNLVKSYPHNSTTWTIVTQPVTADVGPANVVAYAIGLYDPHNCWNVRVVKSSPSGVGQTTGTGSVTCSSGVLVGGGATTDRFLSANYPNTIQGDATSASTWTASFDSASSAFVGTSQSGLTVYALCASPTGTGYSLANFVTSSATSSSGASATVSATATASVSQLAGGGFYISGSFVAATASFNSAANSWQSTAVGQVTSVQSYILELSDPVSSSSGSTGSSTTGSCTSEACSSPTTAPGTCVGEVTFTPRTDAGATWTSDSTVFKIFDVSVVNQGTLPITGAAFPYYIVPPGTITQSWNLNLNSPQGYGSVIVYSPISPGATYSTAGLIIANYTTFSGQYSAEPVQCASN